MCVLVHVYPQLQLGFSHWSHLEAGCAVTLASSKSVQAHVWRDLGGQMAGLLMGTVLLVIANDSDQ